LESTKENCRKDWKGRPINSLIKNGLAGLTTSLAMVPEVVAFALLATVNPLVGLYAAVILGFITAAFGGRPGLISGGAGSLAVVSVALVISHGVEYLFACIVLLGIIQILFGVFKLGKLIKLVSPAVMNGFVNGLAIVIFMAQFKDFPINDVPQVGIMVGLIGLTIVGILWAPIKSIPPSLFGIIPTTLLVVFGLVDSKTVGDIAQISGSLPEFHIPSVPFTFETLWIVLPYSLLLAGIGLVETLLTAQMVDDRLGGTTQPNRESIAQGAGNFLTGLFGGMGGCAMIGQTVINLDSGGTSRISGIVQSLAILAYIVFASVVIESIPIAALIGVMMVVCFHTFDWKTFTKSKEHITVTLIVTVATIVFNLAYAVLIGIIITQIMRKYYGRFV
jgi:sulfate permease, SulP family